MAQAAKSHPERVPQHVVLIPDGNGRWASEHNLPISEGHRRGAASVEGFLRVCRDWQIRFATVWGFSTENWARSRIEVDAIMRLVGIYLRRNRKGFARDGMRFVHLGRRDRLAARYPKLLALFELLEDETKSYQPYTLNLALDYGGRDEILRAVRRMLVEHIDPQTLDWETMSAHLDTSSQPDPDLIIRTSGEHRLSGILPLQAAYAELVFVDRLLPDMREDDYRDAIRIFSERERRFGRRPAATFPESSGRV